MRLTSHDALAGRSGRQKPGTAQRARAPSRQAAKPPNEEGLLQYPPQSARLVVVFPLDEHFGLGLCRP
jgi:hypothetical protein